MGLNNYINRGFKNKDSFKELDNISITGYRIIEILKLLMQHPCSEKDINYQFLNNPLVARSLSKDTICIYINTLRSIGCNISRPSKYNEFKYILKFHPFTLQITNEELQGLIDIRNYISTFNDWKLMLEINHLYRSIIYKIDDSLPDRNKIDELTNHSSYLSDNSLDILAQLNKYCLEKRSLVLNYVSPNSGEKNIEIIADHVFFENDYFYIWCINSKLEEEQYLRIDRIKKISEIKEKNEKYKRKSKIVKYSLKGISASTYCPCENEKILEKNDDYILIEATSTNKFKCLQKLLQYGPDCTILEPDSIKRELTEKLDLILCVYKNE